MATHNFFVWILHPTQDTTQPGYVDETTRRVAGERFGHATERRNAELGGYIHPGNTYSTQSRNALCEWLEISSTAPAAHCEWDCKSNYHQINMKIRLGAADCAALKHAFAVNNVQLHEYGLAGDAEILINNIVQAPPPNNEERILIRPMTTDTSYIWFYTRLTAANPFSLHVKAFLNLDRLWGDVTLRQKAVPNYDHEKVFTKIVPQPFTENKDEEITNPTPNGVRGQNTRILIFDKDIESLEKWFYGRREFFDIHSRNFALHFRHYTDAQLMQVWEVGRNNNPHPHGIENYAFALSGHHTPFFSPASNWAPFGGAAQDLGIAREKHNVCWKGPLYNVQEQYNRLQRRWLDEDMEEAKLKKKHLLKTGSETHVTDPAIAAQLQQIEDDVRFSKEDYEILTQLTRLDHYEMEHFDGELIRGGPGTIEDCSRTPFRGNRGDLFLFSSMHGDEVVGDQIYKVMDRLDNEQLISDVLVELSMEKARSKLRRVHTLMTTGPAPHTLQQVLDQATDMETVLLWAIFHNKPIYIADYRSNQYQPFLLWDRAEDKETRSDVLNWGVLGVSKVYYGISMTTRNQIMVNNINAVAKKRYLQRKNYGGALPKPLKVRLFMAIGAHHSRARSRELYTARNDVPIPYFQYTMIHLLQNKHFKVIPSVKQVGGGNEYYMNFDVYWREIHNPGTATERIERWDDNYPAGSYAKTGYDNQLFGELGYDGYYGYDLYDGYNGYNEFSNFVKERQSMYFLSKNNGIRSPVVDNFIGLFGLLLIFGAILCVCGAILCVCGAISTVAVGSYLVINRDDDPEEFNEENSKV